MTRQSSENQPAQFSESLSPVFRAINSLGGLEATAQAVSKAFGQPVTRQNVRYWLNIDTIPPAYMRIVHTLTGIPVEQFLEHEENRMRERKRTWAVTKM